MLRMWMLGVGTMLLLGPMLAKSWRLFSILENTTLLQVYTCQIHFAINK